MLLGPWSAAIDGWTGLPEWFRSLLLALTALLVANLINRAIDGWSYRRRGLDPWRPAPQGLPPRTWWDQIPLLGWWRLRREADHFQSRFWLRAMAIEILFPSGIVWLYWFEVRGGLDAAVGPAASAADGHAQFLLHFVLVGLMTIATFIDFDEQTIPDEVTLGGTAIGLLLLALVPIATLPTTVMVGWNPIRAHVVFTTSNHDLGWRDGLGGPASWPGWLDETAGLWLALGCLAGWYVAAVPKIWTMRKGLRWAVRFAWGSIRKYRTWRFPTLLLLIMASTTGAAWAWGGAVWEAVFSGIVGMIAVGAGTWGIRLVASGALRVEALGFGDVTLMAMIGTMLGWQAGLLVFFFAPAAALVVALLQWLLTGNREIAFGPYLCLAALGLIVAWRRVWFGWAEPIFSMGWVLPIIVACSLLLLGAMLLGWRWVKESWLELS